MESKPAPKDDPVWSILPSYDMYQDTFNAELNPPDYGEADSVHDPTYTPSHNWSEIHTEATTVVSDQSPDYVDPYSNSSPISNTSLIIADESTITWRETILDNIHNLRNISSSDNPNSQNVDISVHFTEDVGKRGVAPKHIDPSQFEYKQGDFLNGYILIQNKGSIPIPFDMFYVLFEGNFSVAEKGHTSKPCQVNIKNFLEMYDFSASWTQSTVDRVVSEPFQDQYSAICNIDPIDGSHVGIVGRILKPGILYKRFLTFKIPERLLDTECNEHNLTSHTLLPPTLGLCEKQQEMLDQGLQAPGDFSFAGTSTSYRILARFIGKASHFNVNDESNLATKLIDSKGEEFIVFRECASFIRIVQESNILSRTEKIINTETARILYDNLLGRIREAIDQGNAMRQTLAAGGALQDLHSIDFASVCRAPINAIIKARQLYTRLDNFSKGAHLREVKSQNYEISVPLIKRQLLGASKCRGLLQISSSKTEYILNYMSPKQYKSGSSGTKHLWELEIPIKVCFQPSGNSESCSGSKPPRIVLLIPELVVFTAKAGKHPIPVEFTYDHLFRNQLCELVGVKSSDNFDNIVKKPMKSYASELYSYITQFGSNSLSVEKSLLEDVIALASIETKANKLNLRDSRLVESNGTSTSLENSISIGLDKKEDVFSTEFSVVVDATKAQKKNYKAQKLPEHYSSVDEFCLVPSFQNCNIARMYYLRIIIGLSTGELIELKLPVNIAKFPGN